MKMHRLADRRNGLFVFTLLCLCASFTPAFSQAVKWKPDPSLPPPPLTYHGLIPGVSTLEEVRAALKEPVHEGFWYAYKLVYPAEGRPGHFDALHVESEDGKTGTLGTIEAAAIPKDWETWKEVEERLGKPEFFLELYRQSLADYSAKGLRFVFDAERRTVGIAYVPHGKTRVHSGARSFLSLRHLPQGPQRQPEDLPDMKGLRVGTAEVDLTPQKPEWLGGIIKKEEFTIHDPLKARCIVLERDGLSVALVGADLFGMSLSEVKPIEDSLHEKGITYLLLAMAHNHAAPDTLGLFTSFPKAYVEYIQNQVRQGVLEAANNLQPVKKWVAASDELALNGARVEGLFRNARNPGIVDPQIAVLQAVGMDDKPIATIVHFACHVEGLEKGVKEISADFPGYLCDTLKEKLGGGVIFLNGALGGMVSGDGNTRSHDEAKRVGERLAEEAQRILSFAVPPKQMTFSIHRYRVELPLTDLKLFFLFKKNLSDRRILHRGRVVTQMSLLRLGDAKIVTIPGELLPEVSFEILREMGGYPRLIVGLVNDELGYMLPGYDFNAGEYEESMSLGPAAGPMVRDQAIWMLRVQDAGD